MLIQVVQLIATRNYTDLRSIDTTQDVVVDVQDLGVLGDTAYDWSNHVYSGGSWSLF